MEGVYREDDEIEKEGENEEEEPASICILYFYIFGVLSLLPASANCPAASLPR